MGTLKPKRMTIKEQVYLYIKDLILSQRYQLGEKINIDTLAHELNVSNSPIREALMMLEKQGLVENIPNVGSRIISFSPEKYREICASLLIIVTGAYDLCVHLNTVDDAIDKLRSNLRLQQEATNSSDMHTSIKYALEFDKSIVAATGNRYLLSIYEQMEDIFYLMALHSNQRNTEEHQQNIYEHTMILKSVESGDAEAVKHWLYVHYDKHI